MTDLELTINQACEMHPHPKYIFVANMSVYENISENGRFYHERSDGETIPVIVAIMPGIHKDAFYIQ